MANRVQQQEGVGSRFLATEHGKAHKASFLACRPPTTRDYASRLTILDDVSAARVKLGTDTLAAASVRRRAYRVTPNRRGRASPNQSILRNGDRPPTLLSG